MRELQRREIRTGVWAVLRPSGPSAGAARWYVEDADGRMLAPITGYRSLAAAIEACDY